MILDKDTRDIQAYLNNLLPKNRKEKFEERLRNEPTLRAKLEELEPLFDAIQVLKDEEDINEAIINYADQNRNIVAGEQEVVSSTKIVDLLQYLTLKRYLPYVAIASCVLLILGIRWHDYRIPHNLYEEYYRSDNEVSRGSSDKECLNQKQLALYTGHNYTILLKELQNLASNSCIDYYKALCFLAQKESLQAITYFRSATKSTDIYIRNKADWYLALAFLQNNETLNAKKQLQYIISTPDHQYENLAQVLLNELDSRPILFE